jgi:hypothetical protein
MVKSLDEQIKSLQERQGPAQGPEKDFQFRPSSRPARTTSWRGAGNANAGPAPSA